MGTRPTPVFIDGKEAAIYLLRGHSFFDDKFSPVVTQLAKEELKRKGLDITTEKEKQFILNRIKNLSAPSGQLNYVQLVEPGQGVWGLNNAKDEWSTFFDKPGIVTRTGHQVNLDLNSLLKTSSHYHQSGEERFSSEDTKHKFAVNNSNPPQDIEFFNEGEPAQQMGLWDLTPMIAVNNYEGLEQCTFLDVDTPIPNVNSVVCEGGDQSTFIEEFIAKIIQLGESGPGFSRFEGESVKTDDITRLGTAILSELTRKESTGDEFRLRLPLSFISFLIALNTPEEKEIYVIMQSCRFVYNEGDVPGAQQQCMLERFSRLHLGKTTLEEKINNLITKKYKIPEDLWNLAMNNKWKEMNLQIDTRYPVETDPEHPEMLTQGKVREILTKYSLILNDHLSKLEQRQKRARIEPGGGRRDGGKKITKRKKKTRKANKKSRKGKKKTRKGKKIRRKNKL